MIGYRFLFPAEEEMTAASVFYDAASSGLGGDFLDDVQQAIDRACEYPQVGEAIASDLRRLLLHRFPFSVIYSVETDVILVISIAHHARRPGYWQSRVTANKRLQRTGISEPLIDNLPLAQLSPGR